MRAEADEHPAPVDPEQRELVAALKNLLLALPSLQPLAPDGIVAVEVRNAELLMPALVDVLREGRATYCLGLHPRLPPITEQLPLLRALWPGPLVCRWNLNRLHGALGSKDARTLYQPFNALVDPDPALRSTLARVILGTTCAGFPAYVTVNKAEGQHRCPCTRWRKRFCDNRLDALVRAVLSSCPQRESRQKKPAGKRVCRF